MMVFARLMGATRPATDQREPDDREPAPERQAQLRALYESRMKRGQPPYRGATIRTRGELRWILRERGWTEDQRDTAATRPDFRGASFKGALLSGVDLRGADLRGANLDDVDLTEADLRGANLSDAPSVRTYFLRQVGRVAVVLLPLLTLGGEFLLITVLSNVPSSVIDFLAPAFTVLGFVSVAFSILATLGVLARLFRRPDAATSKPVQQQRRRDRLLLYGAQLEGANFSYRTLANVDFSGAYLEQTDLFSATLTNCDFAGAHLDQTNVRSANLTGSRFDSVAELGHVVLDARTRITGVVWNDLLALGYQAGRAQAAGWSDLPTRQGRKRPPYSERIRAWRNASQAFRTTSLALREQGLFVQAAACRLLEQRADRRALLLEFNLLPWLGSWLLDVTAGYGERPGNILMVYVVVVTVFAGIYFGIGYSNGLIPGPIDALVFSLASFHGRGFFPSPTGSSASSPSASSLTLHHPLTVLAAVEAVMGLFVELVLIATFSRRFLAS